MWLLMKPESCPSDKLPLPTEYYEKLKKEAKTNKKHPIYLTYMSSLYPEKDRDKMKKHMEKLSQEIPNLFLIDYDDFVCDFNLKKTDSEDYKNKVIEWIGFGKKEYFEYSEKQSKKNENHQDQYLNDTDSMVNKVSLADTQISDSVYNDESSDEETRQLENQIQTLKAKKSINTKELDKIDSNIVEKAVKLANTNSNANSPSIGFVTDGVIAWTHIFQNDIYQYLKQKYPQKELKKSNAIITSEFDLTLKNISNETIKTGSVNCCYSDLSPELSFVYSETQHYSLFEEALKKLKGDKNKSFFSAMLSCVLKNNNTKSNNDMLDGGFVSHQTWMNGSKGDRYDTVIRGKDKSIHRYFT